MVYWKFSTSVQLFLFQCACTICSQRAGPNGSARNLLVHTIGHFVCQLNNINDQFEEIEVTVFSK